MEMRLMIAYGLIALLIGGLGALIFIVRKKDRKRRGDYR